MAVTHSEAVARINARRDWLLESASNTLALAERLNRTYGDHVAAGQLIAEAAAMVAEAKRFTLTAKA